MPRSRSDEEEEEEDSECDSMDGFVVGEDEAEEEEEENGAGDSEVEGEDVRSPCDTDDEPSDSEKKPRRLRKQRLPLFRKARVISESSSSDDDDETFVPSRERRFSAEDGESESSSNSTNTKRKRRPSVQTSSGDDDDEPKRHRHTSRSVAPPQASLPAAPPAPELSRSALLEKINTIPWTVMHHDTVLEELKAAFVTRAYGAHDRERPLTRILAGPSGVGKTETWRSIVSSLFTKEQWIHVDFSPLVDKLDAALLVGAPPGTEGSSSTRGILTTWIESLPVQDGWFDGCLIIEEPDKGNPYIVQQLMQLVDAGIVRDASTGVEFHRPNLLIIFATNLGAHLLVDSDLRDSIPDQIRVASEISTLAINKICGGHISVAARIGPPLIYIAFTLPQVKSVVRCFIERVLEEIAVGTKSKHLAAVSIPADSIDAIVERCWDPSRGLRSMIEHVFKLRCNYVRLVLKPITFALDGPVGVEQPPACSKWSLTSDFDMTPLDAPNV
jgi:ATP-dependent Clp protease ATP-binding subunit ClpA